MNFLDGATFVNILREVSVSDLVWIPDSTLGLWNDSVTACDFLKVIRPAREGEAMAIAAGLWIGGRHPLVAIQCTGLYEAGDSLRNVIYDLKIPLRLFVGIRSYFSVASGGSDSAAVFARQIVDAWKVQYTLVASAADVRQIATALSAAEARNEPHIILLAE